MRKIDGVRSSYPLFSAYGDQHEFLTTEQAENTDFEGRIKSIWPFIVRRVMAFTETLKPRELANYDAEDVLSEIFLRLAEKDGQWTPGRGKYITYAGVIIDHELHAIRDKARTVHGPRNSSCRMKQYRDEELSGKISERRSKTARDILRTRDGTLGLASSHDAPKGNSFESHSALIADEKATGPLEGILGREACDQSRDAIRQASGTLTALEADVLCRISGLGGCEPESAFWIAWCMSFEVAEVRRAKDRAVTKIRKHLSEMNHPAAST